jgi:hypothetical protein
MSFDPNFSDSQTTVPQNFVTTDTSVGSNPSITDRQTLLQLSDNTYLNYSGATVNYIDFPLSLGSSIEIVGLLPVDYAISQTVKWLDSGGGTLYSKTLSFCFTENLEQFMYSLVMAIAANRGILQNTNYMSNCFAISMFTTYAQLAVETGNDIGSAQQLLDMATYMQQNQTNFF